MPHGAETGRDPEARRDARAPGDADTPGAALRLDAAAARRGLARSRTHAARLIAAGEMRVNGVIVMRAAHPVGVDDAIERVAEASAESPHRYVSRGARKLVAALDAGAEIVRDAPAIDVGASTGGFTEVLLERGVPRIVALDVGHGQLDPRLRGDPRVVVVEGVNARHLDAASLDAILPADLHPAQLRTVVGDLSFISLSLVLPSLAAALPRLERAIFLVKPQFEAGRGHVRDGVVHDANLRAAAIRRVIDSAWEAGLAATRILPSPIAGTHGNREYLAAFRRVADHADAAHPREWDARIRTIAGVG